MMQLKVASSVSNGGDIGSEVRVYCEAGIFRQLF